jgi:phosphoesterase RecJ-like protein
VLLEEIDIQNFKNCIKKASQCLIVTHEFPDIDAIGSCLALSEHLKKQQKNVVIWSAQEIEKQHFFLPNVETIVTTYPNNTHFDTIFVLDASDISRVRKYTDINQHSASVINIDHHPDNTLFGDFNIVKLWSSVGELLFWLLEHCRADITPSMATCLYAAINFDTGRFAYSSVTEHTFVAAAELVKKGAEPYPIYAAMEENKTLTDFELIGIAMDRIKSDPDSGIIYTSIPKTAPHSSLKVIDVIRQISGYKVIVVFQEKEATRVKINLRSKGSFDVSKFAQLFGGGGHKKASGIFLKSSLDSAINSVIPALKEALSQK